MPKKAPPVHIDDVVAAIEIARDKVMSDETKALVKLGLPRAVAAKMVADRYRLKSEDENEPEHPAIWGDLS